MPVRLAGRRNGAWPGPASQQRLLERMGVASKLEQGVDWARVASDVQRGNPVMIDAGDYYMVAERYDPETGSFDFGQSASVLRMAVGRRRSRPRSCAACRRRRCGSARARPCTWTTRAARPRAWQFPRSPVGGWWSPVEQAYGQPWMPTDCC